MATRTTSKQAARHAARTKQQQLARRGWRNIVIDGVVGEDGPHQAALDVGAELMAVEAAAGREVRGELPRGSVRVVVVTEDADNLSLNYLVEKAESVLTPASLPSFPDEEGFVLLLNQQGAVVDEVNYSDDWHFKLIDNAEGVSLERVDSDGPSQEAANWHSAASTAGYGTPGYKNSQFKNLATAQGSFGPLHKK